MEEGGDVDVVDVVDGDALDVWRSGGLTMILEY